MEPARKCRSVPIKKTNGHLQECSKRTSNFFCEPVVGKVVLTIFNPVSEQDEKSGPEADSGGTEKKKEEKPVVNPKFTKETKYNSSEDSVEYKRKDGKWEKEAEKPEDHKEGEPVVEKKITLYQHEWGEAIQGYAGQKDMTERLEKGQPSLGAFYYKAEATSEISVNLTRKEANLTVIKAEATGSIIHGEAAGSFDLGDWIMGLAGGSSKGGGGGGGGPMAARVGDPTGHGSPLAPGIGSLNVLIGGMPAWRAISDMHLCPIVKGLVPDVGGVVTMGSPTVLINGFPACRAGDMVVEIPGGPNPIVTGCPTVMIGVAGAGSGLKVAGKVSGDVLTGKAEAALQGVFNKDEQMLTAKAGVMVAIAKGVAEGSFTVPLWGTHSITLGGSAEGTLGSLGAEGEFKAGHDKDGFQLKVGGKVGAVLGGVGLGFSLGIK